MLRLTPLSLLLDNVVAVAAAVVGEEVVDGARARAAVVVGGLHGDKEDPHGLEAANLNNPSSPSSPSSLLNQPGNPNPHSLSSLLPRFASGRDIALNENDCDQDWVCRNNVCARLAQTSTVWVTAPSRPNPTERVSTVYFTVWGRAEATKAAEVA
ncbi:hypothetical protein B0T14DRAFT_559280 [Immersiella caudata]|uniref:Secreted protein n=1 Tax=Immersiella caudata TaxID=314043 RepID=A0AA39XE32_9PEZI|nr:hypothetical protein B0T14DRAFT_559280 [Immersiella caudata]